MRILFAVLLFLVGVALVAYSYVGGYVDLVREMGKAENLDGFWAPFSMFFHLLTTGEAPPQVTTFLSFGALLMAAGVFMLFSGGKGRDDRRDPV